MQKIKKYIISLYQNFLQKINCGVTKTSKINKEIVDAHSSYLVSQYKNFREKIRTTFQELRQAKADEKNKLDPWARLLLKDSMQRSRLLLYTIAVIIIIFIAWASLTHVDERIETQSAVVIPISQVQEIQNLEGGILKKLFVNEGDTVKKGQPLIQLDRTQADSALTEAQAKYYGDIAKQARLQTALADKDVIEFPEIIKQKYPDIVKSEQDFLRSSRAEYTSSLSALQTTLVHIKEEMAIIKPLVEEQAIPKLNLIKLQRDRSDLESKLKLTETNYDAELRNQLATVNVDIETFKSKIEGLQDRLARTTVVSPVDGIIKKIDIDTVGGVLKPGEEIMNIVPIDEQLLIEGKVAPNNIAFIHPGQSANVSITAYDSSIYGTVPAKVVRISADAITDVDKLGREAAFYKVIVKTDTNALTYRGRELPIIPGMQARVSILTGKKTIMSYLLKPILKVKQNALRER
jgi:adhesin transport system membrane fusion protein